MNSIKHAAVGPNISVVCHVHTNSNSSITGIAQTGFFDIDNVGLTTALGKLSWGRLYGSSNVGTDLKRSANPISIGVTGLTVDAGLSTFPTIQRRNYDNIGETGHRNTGSIRAKLT